MEKDKNQTIVLTHLKNILEVGKSKDYINELFESRTEYILYNLGNIANIKKYDEEIYILEDKINKKLKNGMKYIHYVDNYATILKSKDDKIQSILYRYGISDGLKIVEGTFKGIDSFNGINEQVIEGVLYERFKKIIEQINNSEMIKEINVKLKEFEDKADKNIKNEVLVKEYKVLEKNMKEEYERLIYIVGIYDVLSIIYEGKQEDKISLS